MVPRLDGVAGLVNVVVPIIPPSSIARLETGEATAARFSHLIWLIKLDIAN